MTRRSVSLFLILAIVALTAAGVYLIQAVEDPHPPEPSSVAVAVAVVRIAPRPFTHNLEALGTVQAIREAAISAEVAGPVAKVPPAVELGAPTEQGVLLAEIDPTPFRIETVRREALLARAKAQIRSIEVEIRRQESLIRINRDKLNLARSEHTRLADLLKRELIAPQDLERAELTLRRIQEELELAESGLREANAKHAVAVADAAAAAAELARARQALADTQVRAPFAGVISEKLVTVGEQVAPGTVLFRLADLAVVKILARVRADNIGLLHPGAVAQLRVAGFPEAFHGRVAHVGPRADTATRTFPVEILVDNKGPRRLLPGMFARASIPVRSYPTAILIPRSSVVARDGAPIVFIADAERQIVHSQGITIARTFGSRYLIHEGLAPGDLLVVTGQHLLRDGAPVQVVETRQLEP
ncbi:MAG: efflux RND transporter periplasmic adaptor subunit [Candidatus Methylomirabilia bacterium]